MECTYARTPALERGYAEVAGRAFKRPTEFRDQKTLWMKRPRYKREHTRIVIDDGTVVAGVAIVELPVRYGDATLKLGGISCVATDPDAWKKGYGRACMSDTVDYMIRDGFDISFLLGIRNYYHRFGYRTSLRWFVCRYAPRDVEAKMPPGMRSRKMRKSDIPKMAALYEKTIGRCDLSVVRTKEDWKWYFRFGRFSNGQVLLDGRGNVLAYAQISGGGRINELAVVDSVEAYEGVLAIIREEARNSFVQSVDIFAPPEGGFARYCHYKKRIGWHYWTDYEGGPMLRLMNVDEVFRKIGGTLSRRWQSAPRSIAAEAVTVKCPLGSVAFVPRDRELLVRPGEAAGQVVEIPAEALTELVMGFRPVGDILADSGVTTTDAAKGVLGAIFPVSVPFMPPTDHM